MQISGLTSTQANAALLEGCEIDVIKASTQAGDDAQLFFCFVENGFVNLGGALGSASRENAMMSMTAAGTLSLSMTSKPSAPFTFFKIPDEVDT